MKRFAAVLRVLSARWIPGGTVWVPCYQDITLSLHGTRGAAARVAREAASLNPGTRAVVNYMWEKADGTAASNAWLLEPPVPTPITF